jgi:pimeloyl-ACP methyl ester carboxylesterase
MIWKRLRQRAGCQLSRVGLLATVFTSFLTAGCIAPRPAEKPMPSQFYDSEDQDKQYLVVFLPGRGDDIGAYERGGFIDILRQSGRPLDSVVVDAHLGYYIERSLAERVYEDVLLPYRERGYERFIVVGISLGGVGALRLRADYGDLIFGTVLLAPYLGGEGVLGDIKAAGDVHSWRAQLDHEPAADEQIWTWIEPMIDPTTQQIPSTLLAYGEDDKFRPAGELFGEMLPASNVFTRTGGHKWNTWRPLWSEITSDALWQDFGLE